MKYPVSAFDMNIMQSDMTAILVLIIRRIPFVMDQTQVQYITVVY